MPITPHAPCCVAAARPDQAPELTTIAFAAKRHWGYPESWIVRWSDGLTITAAYVRANPTFVASRDGAILGFGAIVLAPDVAVLDHLWVVPAAMRGGIGRTLFAHGEQLARRAGAGRLRIVGDPHAEGFYLRMGAQHVGGEPAAMDDHLRVLPVFEKPLSPHPRGP